MVNHMAVAPVFATTELPNDLWSIKFMRDWAIREFEKVGLEAEP
jgi:hypothetical protein